MRRRIALCLIAFATSGSVASGFAEESIDASSGLILAPGWQQVRAHCGACHSLRLVTANRGDEQQWLASIRWMQKKHNLWSLPADVEQSILGYLASQYPALEPSRRKNLAPELLP